MTDKTSMTNGIPLELCQNRVLYQLTARNLTCGVYVAEKKGFIGLRTKFTTTFLDMEFHYDTGAPFGTATPIANMGATVPPAVQLVAFLPQVCAFCGLPVEWMGPPGPAPWSHRIQGHALTTDCQDARPVSQINTPLFDWISEWTARLTGAL